MFFKLLLTVPPNTQKGSRPKGQALVPKHMTTHFFPYLGQEEQYKLTAATSLGQDSRQTQSLNQGKFQ